MYFNKFQKIQYDIKGDGNLYTMTNLMRRVKFNNIVKSNIISFDFYDVQDGDTPEIIAYYYYENIDLYWTILLANDIIDIYSQWPMSVPKFEQYVYDKYTDINAVHHYEIYQASGNTNTIIEIPNNTGYSNAVPVTNYVHEDRLQQGLRQIRLIQPEYTGMIVKEFENLMSKEE
tara:strand:- start:91 stop:612 length:522 start_codon:yes stop_codon:yes gene_type:complete